MERYELKISPKRIQELVEGIREGLPIKYACDLAFIYTHQYQKWKRDYENFLAEYATKTPEEQSKLDKLLEIPVDKDDNLVYSKLNILTLMTITTHARADCLKTYLYNLKTDADHFQRWSWLLERTFRKDFGKDIVEEAPSNQVDKIKVVYVESDADKNRLSKLEEEVKESLGIDGNRN